MTAVTHATHVQNILCKGSIHKIQTYAFDLRPKLYVVLEKCGYKKEKVLFKSYNYNDNLINIVIHSKIKE